MAEVVSLIGLISSAASIADIGLRVSRGLYEYHAIVKITDRSIKQIAQDVEDTAIVLRQFSQNLEDEKRSQVCSNEFYRAAKQNVAGCEGIFKELDSALDETGCIHRSTAGEIIGVSTRRRDRLRWPLRQANVDILQRNLERFKSSLSVKVQLMHHSRALLDQRLKQAEDEKMRQVEAMLIESLELKARAAELEYLSLKRKAESAGNCADHRTVTLADSSHLHQQHNHVQSQSAESAGCHEDSHKHAYEDPDNSIDADWSMGASKAETLPPGASVYTELTRTQTPADTTGPPIRVKESLCHEADWKVLPDQMISGSAPASIHSPACSEGCLSESEVGSPHHPIEEQAALLKDLTLGVAAQIAESNVHTGQVQNRTVVTDHSCKNTPKNPISGFHTRDFSSDHSLQNKGSTGEFNSDGAIDDGHFFAVGGGELINRASLEACAISSAKELSKEPKTSNLREIIHPTGALDSEGGSLNQVSEAAAMENMRLGRNSQPPSGEPSNVMERNHCFLAEETEKKKSGQVNSEETREMHNGYIASNEVSPPEDDDLPHTIKPLGINPPSKEISSSELVEAEEEGLNENDMVGAEEELAAQDPVPKMEAQVHAEERQRTSQQRLSNEQKFRIPLKARQYVSRVLNLHHKRTVSVHGNHSTDDISAPNPNHLGKSRPKVSWAKEPTPTPRQSEKPREVPDPLRRGNFPQQIPAISHISEISDQRSFFVFQNVLLSSVQPTQPQYFECWLLQPAEPAKGQVKSWNRIIRNIFPLDDTVLDGISISRPKSVYRTLRALSSVQQQQVQGLLHDLWALLMPSGHGRQLAAIRIHPRMSPTKKCKSLFIILRRMLTVNGQPWLYYPHQHPSHYGYFAKYAPTSYSPANTIPPPPHPIPSHQPHTLKPTLKRTETPIQPHAGEITDDEDSDDVVSLNPKIKKKQKGKKNSLSPHQNNPSVYPYTLSDSDAEDDDSLFETDSFPEASFGIPHRNHKGSTKFGQFPRYSSLTRFSTQNSHSYDGSSTSPRAGRLYHARPTYSRSSSAYCDAPGGSAETAGSSIVDNLLGEWTVVRRDGSKAQESAQSEHGSRSHEEGISARASGESQNHGQEGNSKPESFSNSRRNLSKNPQRGRAKKPRGRERRGEPPPRSTQEIVQEMEDRIARAIKNKAEVDRLLKEAGRDPS